MVNIQEIMKNDLKKIGIDLDTDERYRCTSFNPDDMRWNRKYSEFIFADEKGYHYVCPGTRESEHVDKTFEKAEDLLYYVYRGKAFNIASFEAGKYWLEHRDCDITAIMRSRMLEILKALGEEYYLRRLQEIKEKQLQEEKYFETTKRIQ